MQLFLGAVPIIFKLFSNSKGHLLFSNYSGNNLPKPSDEPVSCVSRVLHQRPCTIFYTLLLHMLETIPWVPVLETVLLQSQTLLFHFDLKDKVGFT